MPSRPLRVLIVEERQYAVDLLAQACRRGEVACEFTHCTHAELAAATLVDGKRRDRVPDVLIFDLDQSGATGHALVALIHDDELLRTISVMVLTSAPAPHRGAAIAGSHHSFARPGSLEDWAPIVAAIGRCPLQGGGRAPPRVARILHIEDDADDRQLFALAFARSGLEGELYQVDSSAAAMLYLDQPGRHRAAGLPDLIVLDLGLPRTDGRGFLATLRETSRFERIPVVILTGSESYADIARTRALAIVDYVVKPGTQQEMSELIASFKRWLVLPAPSPSTPRPPS